MAYITLKATNIPRSFGIQIETTVLGDSVGDADKIAIVKKNSAGEQIIEERHISNASEASITIMDTNVLAGNTYTYFADLYNDETLVERVQQQSTSIVCANGDGLFIQDCVTGRTYIAPVNFKTEIKRNTNVEYVTTLASKYPFRVSNDNVNYTSGTSSGLFLEYNYSTGEFDRDYNHRRSTEIIDFLTNNNNKLLKTHDGMAFIVGIDAGPSEVYTDFAGLQTISFNWTEVGDALEWFDEPGERNIEGHIGYIVLG